MKSSTRSRAFYAKIMASLVCGGLVCSGTCTANLSLPDAISIEFYEKKKEKVYVDLPGLHVTRSDDILNIGLHGMSLAIHH